MYKIFDLTLDSQIPLPELAEATTSSAELIRITLEPHKRLPETVAGIWQHEFHDPEGSVAIQSARLDEQYLLRFPAICDFVISLEQSAISCMPHDAVPAESVRHLVLDQVVPRMLGQKGRLILHASACVSGEDAAVAFVGESGWGKSTMASAFHDDGFRLLADDCLLLKPVSGGVISIPSYYGLRLYEDSADVVLGSEAANGVAVAHYTDKKRHLHQTTSDKRLLDQPYLAAVFLLHDPGEPPGVGTIKIEPIKGAEEVMAIIRQMFVLDPTDNALTIKQFKLAAGLVASDLPIYRLSYPREFSLLAEVRQAVKNTLGLD